MYVCIQSKMNQAANNTSEPFGFIVTRHVTNSETAKYWIE